jgi:outer membrane lipoprotein-sorting protein
MPGSVQTEVRVGNIGIPRDHSDYMRLNLATRILGGEGANRLHQILRTERGLTYGAQADMHARKERGDLEASTSTRSEATGEVLRLMVDEFWRLQRERVNRRELSEAQAYLSGSFPLTIEVPDAIATQILNVVFYGLPVEQLQSFRERVNRVTVDDIQRVARSYFRPDRLSIVLVGDAATFVPQLRGIGFGSYEVIEIDELDLTTTDFKRRESGQANAAAAGGAGVERLRIGRPFAYQPAPAVGAGADRRASELVDRVIAAKGGYTTLQAVRTITAVTRAEIVTPTGTVLTEATTYLQYPNQVRVETKLPDAEIVQVFDGQRAWVKDPDGVHDVPDSLVSELTASFERDTIAALLAAKEGDLRARVLPDVTEQDGGRRHVLELSSPSTEPIVLYIDTETALVAKQAYVAGGPGQPLVEERFTDYRAVDGVQIAFTATITRGGHPVLKRHVTEIRVNTPLDAALFDRPSS